MECAKHFGSQDNFATFNVPRALDTKICYAVLRGGRNDWVGEHVFAALIGDGLADVDVLYRNDVVAIVRHHHEENGQTHEEEKQEHVTHGCVCGRK